jgi:fatty acid desaturase
MTPPSNEFAVFQGGRISRATTATGRKRSGQGRILRYRIDILSVLTVVSVLAFQLVAYFLDLPWYLIIVLPIPIRGLHLIEHNHSHLKIFRQNLLNEVLDWMFFISNGVPVECYEMHHVHNHHRFAQ